MLVIMLQNCLLGFVKYWSAFVVPSDPPTCPVRSKDKYIDKDLTFLWCKLIFLWCKLTHSRSQHATKEDSIKQSELCTSSSNSPAANESPRSSRKSGRDMA